MSKIYVVGIGPGGPEDMTFRAVRAISGADVIVGYSAYIDLIKDLFPGKNFISSGMTREVERCELVLEKAREGNNVALVSSGDSGIYGMAGIMLEVAGKAGEARCAGEAGEAGKAGDAGNAGAAGEAGKSGDDIVIEVIPGVTAASAAASILGAPVMHDFAVISLSDLMTPWELIVKRIEYAALGDFVICIYNPKSKKRSDYINIARDIIIKSRRSETPVGIVRNAGRQDESHVITTLGEMLECEIDMFTVIIVGNSGTYTQDGKMITPRGYRL